jgi:hypothetical protein
MKQNIRNTNALFRQPRSRQVNYSKADAERIDLIVAYADQNLGYLKRVGMILPDHEKNLAQKITQYEHELKHQFSRPIIEGEDLMLYPGVRAELALQRMEKLKQELVKIPKFSTQFTNI